MRLFLTGLLSLLPLALPAAQITLGVNAVVNGDAESSVGGNGAFINPIPGWALSTGKPTIVLYNVPGSFPSSSDPGGSVGGNNFFAGGPNAGTSSMSQTLDVSNIAALIDTGLINYSMSAYLGGWQNHNDVAVFRADFYDGSTNLLQTQVLTGPNAAQRSNQTGLFQSSTTGFIPVGTRSIIFLLGMSYSAGDYNDGYADNLSFIATQSTNTATPEPTTALLLGLPLLALCCLRRTRA